MANVLVVGAGVVGRATGNGLASLGHAIVFKDTDPVVRAELTRLGQRVWEDSENATPDLIFICVATPTTDGRADLSQVEAACRDLGPILSQATAYPVVILRSTVPPGTMPKRVAPWLEAASGRKADVDFGVCFNPEFLRRASAEADFLNPWSVVIGRERPASAEPLLEVLAPILERSGASLHITSFRAAELTKYAANLFNATKISFANEVWLAARALGLDGNGVMAMVATAAEAMWNPAYGIRGGDAFRGGCLPKDLEAFLGFAGDSGIETPLIEAVAAVNQLMAGAVSDGPSVSP
jgi:UDPglucose 6-dehydrogenase